MVLLTIAVPTNPEERAGHPRNARQHRHGQQPDERPEHEHHDSERQATVIGTVNQETPEQKDLNVNAPVKGSGTRGAPFKVEFDSGSLEWF